jgi:adenylate kinase family enzyme
MAATASEQPGGGPRRPEAVLLVGPTASGKTPLGDLLQARGLWGRACVHFDFGRVLRACVLGVGDWGLAPDDCALLAAMLQRGVLLENEHFHLAERLLLAFLSRRPLDDAALVVLNGLPRHVGQAEQMPRFVRMRAVVHLVCPEEAVFARIRRNAGGDRAERDDDGHDRVREKLALFRERTKPLLAHYREQGVPLIPVEVGPATAAEAMREALEAHGPA